MSTLNFIGPYHADKALGTWDCSIKLYGTTPGGKEIELVLKMEPYEVEYLVNELQSWATRLRDEAARLCQSIGEAPK